MKNCILILLFTIIFPHFSQSQENKLLLNEIISDSTTIENNKIWDTHFPPILDSKNKIEIRIFRIFPNEYLMLSYNNSWLLEKHSYDTKTRKFDIIKINNQEKVKKIFENLVANNVFSLPDGNKTASRHYYDLEKNEIVGDGFSVSHPFYYCIEFKIANEFRRYYYYEPEKQHIFLPKNQELRQFVEIIKLLNKIN